jgi:hypothetical protein
VTENWALTEGIAGMAQDHRHGLGPARGRKSAPWRFCCHMSNKRQSLLTDFGGGPVRGRARS